MSRTGDLSEPRREQYLDDESFERADADYWAWYDAEESKREDY